MRFSSVPFGLPYLLIELFYIGVPVVRTGGRSGGVRSLDYQNVSDAKVTKFSYSWCSAARASRTRAPLILEFPIQ